MARLESKAAPPAPEVVVEATLPGDSAPAPEAEKPAEKPAEASKPSDEESSRGYARPKRDTAVHKGCGHVTVLRPDVAEFFARSPKVIGALRCDTCRADFPVAAFTWHGSKEVVGS